MKTAKRMTFTDDGGTEYRSMSPGPLSVKVSGATGVKERVQFVLGSEGKALVFEVSADQARRIAVQLMVAASQSLGMSRDDVLAGISPKVRTMMEDAEIDDECVGIIDAVYSGEAHDKARTLN